MDARTSCLRWHRPHKVFPWLGVPLPQPETHCGVMLGRVQGPLIQESDVSDSSESITSASTKAGPSHSPGLGRWQCKVLAGGKLSWGSSALSSPSQNKAGKPLDGHWRRQWRRGWWDTGSYQVLGLCRRTHCTWLMPPFQWMGGMPALLMIWSMSPYPGEGTALLLLVTLP